MNNAEFLKKSKDLIEIEFFRYKAVSPKMILSEQNIYDYMEARQFQLQGNGLVVLDFQIIAHQIDARQLDAGGEMFKDYVAMIMQNLRNDRQQYIYVSEAYYCMGTDGNYSSSDLQAYFNEHGTLKGHPTQFDCMLLNYFDGDNINVHINKIVDPETDRAFLTEWFNPDPENTGKQEGRFTDERQS